MIKYYGMHGCKQFIRGKPIRFGYKAWCLNQTNGYLVNLELYQGARLNAGEEDALNAGKAATPLIRMIDELPEDIIRLPFRFYFNRNELVVSFKIIRIWNNWDHSAKPNS